MTISPESAVTSNVPRPLTRFIGRDDEIDAIAHLVMRDDVRLVTLTGPGGIGKTRLSIEVSRRIADLGGLTVRFISLAVASGSDDALQRIASELGLWNAQAEDVIPRLTSLLEHERMLLVLDNLEHVIDISGELAQLLAATTNLTLLATSRSPLHIQGEREYSVPQLTTPSASSANDATSLLESEAVALFVDRATAINHDFQITPDNGRAIAGICAKLDGLPLAIELAAARTRTLPPSTLLARLDDQLGLLRSESRDLPERLRTIRATINWSYQLLTPVEQQTLRRISVFVGDFSLSAAMSILDLAESGTLDTIESLIDKSLLLSRQPFNDEPHFRMLTVVRQFGLEQLSGSGEDYQVRLRQAEWAASFSEAVFAHQFGPQQRDVLRQIDRIHETIRQSLIWAIDHEEWDIAARIGAHLWQYWYLYGFLAQGRIWLRRIVQQERNWSTELLANLYFGFGTLAGSPEESIENQSHAERLLEQHQATGDIRMKAIGLNLLALCRDTQLARESAERAAEAWRASGDTIWYGLVLGLAGRWAREAGDLDRSESYSRMSLDIMKQVGHEWGVSLALLGIGRVHQLRGQINEATNIYLQGLAMLPNLGDRILVLRYFEFMMYVAESRADLTRSLRIAGSATRLRETMGYQLRYHAEQKLVTEYHDRVRLALGKETFEQEWATGYRYTHEQAIDEALSIRSTSDPPAPATSSHERQFRLTRRECDVLERIIEGKTDQVIADELYVSYRTVTTHVTNILNKLGANTRTEAATIALRDNIVSF